MPTTDKPAWARGQAPKGEHYEMAIPFGPLRLQITLRRASDHRKGWEKWVAPGLDDRALARLNEENRRESDSAYRTGWRVISRPGSTR